MFVNISAVCTCLQGLYVLNKTRVRFRNPEVLVFANRAEDKPIHSQCDEYMDRWTVDLFFGVVLAKGPHTVVMSEVTKQCFRMPHE